MYQELLSHYCWAEHRFVLFSGDLLFHFARQMKVDSKSKYRLKAMIDNTKPDLSRFYPRMTDTHLQSQSTCSHTSSNILLCESLATFQSEDGALLATAFDSSSIMKRAPASRSMKMYTGWRSGVLKSIAFVTLATLVPRVMSDTSYSKIGIHSSELFQG
jgi:hypothetical protein